MNFSSSSPDAADDAVFDDADLLRELVAFGLAFFFAVCGMDIKFKWIV
jgi:hypothetical protein